MNDKTKWENAHFEHDANPVDGSMYRPAAAQEAVYEISHVSPMNFGGFCAQIITPTKLDRGTKLYAAPVAAAPVDLHAHLLHMLGAKDHEDAGRIIGELHAASMSTPAAPGIDVTCAARIAELEAQVKELDRLCDATYVAQGADAYSHACDMLEQFQAARAAAGKEIGTEGSLCDGMAWLYGRLDELEALIDASPKGGIDACAWAGDGEGNWHTACGEIFTLMEGTPTDNKMHHCPYCGKNLMTTGTDVCVAVIGDSYEDTRSEAHDAARYRWLRNHYEPFFHDSECDSLIGLHGEYLDDAIDDEMQATSAEVGA